MSLIFIEGFDEYEIDASDAQLKYKWNFTSGHGHTVKNDHPRADAYKYLYMSGGYHTDPWLQKKFFEPIINNKFVFGEAIRFWDTNGRGPMFALLSTQCTMFKTYYEYDGTIQLWRLHVEIRNNSNSVIGNYYSDYIFKSSEWAYVEGKIEYIETVHDIDYGKIIFKWNGLEIINEPYIEIPTLELFTIWTSTYWNSYGRSGEIDDLYVLDGSGSYNNDFLGEIHVRALKPNANGAVNDFTPVGEIENYNCVNNLNIDDTNYTKGDSVGMVEVYNFDSLPASDTQVLGVFTQSDCRKEGYGYRRVKTVIHDGVNAIPNSEEHTLANGHRRYEDKYEVNPYTGNPFTVAEFNNMQFGITITQ